MSIADKLTTVAEKLPEVFESGKAEGRQSAYDEFWDGFQNYGQRLDYGYAFQHWKNDMFRPKYDIKPIGQGAARLFAYSGISDVAAILQECGVTLDTSQCTLMGEICGYTDRVKRMPEISFENYEVTKTEVFGAFYGAWGLKTIDAVVLKPDGTQPLSFASNTSRIANITVKGKIGGANSDLRYLPKLTADSCRSITDALVDYSGTEGENQYTIYFHSAVIELLRDDCSTPNGVSLYQYIQEKGWNIA